MSLRGRVLLGIALANLAAFSILAVLVLRDVDLRRSRDREWRDTYTTRVGNLIAEFLTDLDFAGDAFAVAAHNVLNQRYGAYASDAYITNLIGTEEPFFGDFQLNLTRFPDPTSERLRRANGDLVKQTFRDAEHRVEPGAPMMLRRRGDVVVIPLYRSVAQVSRAGGGSRRPVREKWGAAYFRVAVPSRVAPEDALTLWQVAIGMGGATLAGMGLVYLMLLRLILRPIDRIAAGARRISGGDLLHRVGETGRGDEIDELIRTFNSMQVEIRHSREALEQRVAEAVDRVRATEKRMVLNERLAAVGTLAAGIAHEINNPIGGMMNALATLRRKADDPGVRERYLGLMDEGLKRIRDVVQRVLRFSRSGGGVDELMVRALVDDAVRFVGHRLKETGVEISVEVADDLSVKGDMVALGQVLLNLLLNAIDAIGERRGRIRVTGVRENGLSRVTVEDDGCGMTPEQRDRAFDHFYTTKQAGTGLGLSIVHEIVSEHGGRVLIDSEVGRGTAIHVVLPA